MKKQLLVLTAAVGLALGGGLAQAETVKIGLMAPLTGSWASEGQGMKKIVELLAEQQKLLDYGLPLLVGMSRKSMIGNLLGRPVDERLAGSLACALIGLQHGARIIRVHDVRATMDVLRTGWMTMTGQDFISK